MNEDDKQTSLNEAETPFSLAFGPVPSRRLGRSVGVNVVPFKTCTYSCIYCQLGPTDALRTRRKRYFDPQDVAGAVEEVVRGAQGNVDTVTVIGEGEPTLASNLGDIVKQVKTAWQGRMALISNGSLFWKRAVRKDARGFDVVSVNVSTGDERTFSRLHRPAKELTQGLVTEGLRKFSRTYGGELWTETMLVRDVNDGPDQLEAIRERVLEISPDRSFLTVPTRPPTLSWVKPPLEESYKKALRVLDFAFDMHRPEGEFPKVGGEGALRLLRISEMHPLREEQAVDILRRGQSDVCARSILASMVKKGQLKVRLYRGVRYYSRARRRGAGHDGES